MTVERRTVDVKDLDLPAGRRLRIEVERLPSGEPESLRLQLGWTDPWRPDRDHGLFLPAGVLPDLREALEALED